MYIKIAGVAGNINNNIKINLVNVTSAFRYSAIPPHTPNIFLSFVLNFIVLDFSVNIKINNQIYSCFDIFFYICTTK